jgi:hypothetical protein
MPRRGCRRGPRHPVGEDVFTAASDLADRRRLVVVVYAGSVALPEALAGTCPCTPYFDMTDPHTDA